MAASALSHLERRKIEAGVLIPMIKAFQQAMGVDKANEVARSVVRELAKQDGERWAEQHGRGLDGMDKVSRVWAGGGSLEIEPVRRTDTALEFNVTRCKYAEHFQALGLPELGYLIHCNRDFAMLDGFSDRLDLERTQTVMQGASHCDFRFKVKAAPQDSGRKP
jgi:L-2-amino-thiazoline-4-carboxylic acid hydrolase